MQSWKKYSIFMLLLVLTLPVLLGFNVPDMTTQENSPKPSHMEWSKAPMDPFEWEVPPSNQVIGVTQSFSYDLNALPEGEIDTWEINDTVNFAINTEGTITNATSLLLGSYGINVKVNSTLGDLLSANFSVRVQLIPVVKWTVLVYLDGDNNLEEYAFNDLNSMELIGPNTDVKIIVLVDFYDGYDAPFSGGKCYEIQQDSNLNSINSLELAAPIPSEPNMGSANTLRDFINFSQAYAPAEHYLLIIWDHGAGAFGLCSDDTSSDRLTIAELNQALSDPTVQHLDIVAFDACLMGQLEVAYEIRSTTDYVVFSEQSVPLTGFPYEDILLNLTTFAESSPGAVASSLVYYYVTAYDFGGRYYDMVNSDICLSAVKTSKLDAVALNLNQLAEALLVNVATPEIYETITWSRCFAQGFDWADFIDLRSFAESLALQFNGAPPFHQFATNLSVSVQNAIHEEMHLSGVPEAFGLGAVFGTYGSHQLALADDTEWDEFMEAFIDVGSTMNNAIQYLDDLVSPSGSPLHCGYLDSSEDSVFFEFLASVSGTHHFSIEAAWDQYATDFDLYIHDASGNSLASSISSDSTEYIAFNLEAGNTYFIEVYSYPSGYDGIGVFYLNIDSQSGPGPLPPQLTQLLIAGAIVGIIIGVGVIIMYTRHRQSTSAIPPRYTSPTTTPPRVEESADVAKFCTYCGAAVPYAARYCPVCGSSLR
ncbi:MAG: clostripain-related cysteine peptidase [Candidatus Hermodarchaeia archaeon]|jgi:hypothetical protein